MNEGRHTANLSSCVTQKGHAVIVRNTSPSNMYSYHESPGSGLNLGLVSPYTRGVK